MRFVSRYSRERSPEPMLELEPSFYLAFFRSHFDRHKAAIRAAMELTFDHVDSRLGISLNRNGVAEAVVRMQLSTLMVPVDQEWVDLWEIAPARIAHWIAYLGGPKRGAGAAPPIPHGSVT
jgi:hypothetical protein